MDPCAGCSSKKQRCYNKMFSLKDEVMLCPMLWQVISQEKYHNHSACSQNARYHISFHLPKWACLCISMQKLFCSLLTDMMLYKSVVSLCANQRDTLHVHQKTSLKKCFHCRWSRTNLHSWSFKQMPQVKQLNSGTVSWNLFWTVKKSSKICAIESVLFADFHMLKAYY